MDLDLLEALDLAPVEALEEVLVINMAEEEGSSNNSSQSRTVWGLSASRITSTEQTLAMEASLARRGGREKFG